MKSLWCVAMLVLVLAQAAEAFEPRWRWRNDDGDIYLATWKDSLNCPIICCDGKNLRLRTVVVPSEIAPADTPATISLRYWNQPFYDTWNAGEWMPITRADTGMFFLSDSKYLQDGVCYQDDAAFNIWGNGNSVTYLGTIAIDTSSRYSLTAKPHNGGYEFEYCLKANLAKIPEGAVYYFVSFLNEGLGPYDNDPPCLRFPPFYWKYHKQATGAIGKVQFIDTLNGWYQKEEDGRYPLRRTTDGGESWTMAGRQLSDSPFYFLTRDTGWAIIENRLCQSTDGGAGWMPRDEGVEITGSSPHSIFFSDMKHGWMTSLYDSMMRRTVDGGATWSRIPSPEWTILSTHFLTERIGFAIGESLYKTVDGGTSWRLVQSVYDLPQAEGHAMEALKRLPTKEKADPLQPYVGQIQFVDSSMGWALTYNGKLCRTVDAGEHWTLLQTFRTPRALAMHFSGRLTGWIVGEQGMILATKDGGTTWEKRPSGTGHDLRTIEAVNNHLWIGAKDGTLLSSASGGWLTTLDEKKAPVLSEDCVFYPNYPNPFNPTTTIRYALPKASHVTIKVFDILGREVSTLVDEQKSSGTYETSWNGTRCASGIYLCRMQAGSYQRVRLMALVK